MNKTRKILIFIPTKGESPQIITDNFKPIYQESVDIRLWHLEVAIFNKNNEILFEMAKNLLIYNGDAKG